MSNSPKIKDSNNAGEGAVVLAVDTATPRMTFVIAREEQLLALISGDSNVPHSRTFFDNLSLALSSAGLELESIDLFAAVTGPGSFTGLRVGLAAVKGLAETTGRPAVGISGIDLVALSAGIAGEILVMLEAGRSEVYAGLRSVGADGSLTPIGNDLVGRPSDLLPSIIENRSPALMTGSGLDRHLEEVASKLEAMGRQSHTSACFDRRYDAIQLITSRPETGTVMASLALKLHRSGLTPPLSACYIRPSDAELKFFAAVEPAKES